MELLKLDHLHLSLDKKANPLENPIITVTGEVSETRDWASLPGDLLVVVAGRLTSLADFSSFRRVCSSWRSNVIHSAETLASQSPLVMLHVQNRVFYFSGEENEEDDDEDDTCWDKIFPRTLSFDVVFFDVMKGCFYKCESSSSSQSFYLLNFFHGYLAKALKYGQIVLPHFFTNDEIWLPKTSRPFGDSDQRKLIFSGDFSSPHCLFALYSTYSSTIEFCQKGDSSWKIQGLGPDSVFGNMVFFQGKMYALIGVDHHLVVIEFNPNFTLNNLGAKLIFYGPRPTLFTSGDELLVCCLRDIFIWDFERSRWVLKSNFDDRAIFHSSDQLTAFMNPTQDSWIKPNHQYSYDVNRCELEQRISIISGDRDVSKEYFDYRAGRGSQSQCVGNPVMIFPSICF